MQWLEENEEYADPGNPAPSRQRHIRSRDGCERQDAKKLIGGWLADGERAQNISGDHLWGDSKKGVIKRKLKDGRRGRPLSAITRYRTLLSNERYSLVRVTIETGRKHQIRRHFEGIGHPVVGDTRYRGRIPKARVEAASRLALHSWKLELPGFQAVFAPLDATFQSLLMSTGLEAGLGIIEREGA